MTLFNQDSINMRVEGFDRIVRVIPQEYLEVHAFMLFEQEGRQHGSDLRHYEQAKEFFKNHPIVPTETYLRYDSLNPDARRAEVVPRNILI